MPSADSCAVVRSPLRFPQFRIRNTTQVSPGKLGRPSRTPAGSTHLALDGYGLRDQLLARPTKPASYPVSVRQVAVLLHASFRHHLAAMPLRFANPSPPSGWIEDFHFPSYRACWAHNHPREPRPISARCGLRWSCSSAPRGAGDDAGASPPWTDVATASSPHSSTGQRTIPTTVTASSAARAAPITGTSPATLSMSPSASNDCPLTTPQSGSRTSASTWPLNEFHHPSPDRRRDVYQPGILRVEPHAKKRSGQLDQIAHQSAPLPAYDLQRIEHRLGAEVHRGVPADHRAIPDLLHSAA